MPRPAPSSVPAAPVRIGCSGWMYRHWRGDFYPPGLAVKRWFARYAAVFGTVEINNSFYRLPPAETFAAWRRQAPPGFCYAVKANRYLTQAKKLRDCAEPVARMFSAIGALGDACGPVLYQLPPRFRLNLARLEAFLALLPGGYDHVFEFRDDSWNDETVFALLEHHGAGFCTHDLPGFTVPRRATGPLAYVRFHGGEGKYWGRYTRSALDGWAQWLAAEARAGRSVWAYFNNDIGGAAIHDALALRAMLGQALPELLPGSPIEPL